MLNFYSQFSFNNSMQATMQRMKGKNFLLWLTSWLCTFLLFRRPQYFAARLNWKNSITNKRCNESNYPFQKICNWLYISFVMYLVIIIIFCIILSDFYSTFEGEKEIINTLHVFSYFFHSSFEVKDEVRKEKETFLVYES